MGRRNAPTDGRRGSQADAAAAGGPGASKTCARCGRPMAWRRAWRDVWHEVQVCSDACRRRDPQAEALEKAIRELAARRGRSATFCPSEATRVVFGAKEAWPADAMERTRQAARRLVAQGHVEVLQGGKVVDAGTFRGPIRLRQAEPASPEPERVTPRRGRTKPT